jgi:hypothetical protein
MALPNGPLEILNEIGAHIAKWTKLDRDQAAVKARRLRAACEEAVGPHQEILRALQSYSADLLAYLNSGEQQWARDQVDEMVRITGQIGTHEV